MVVTRGISKTFKDKKKGDIHAVREVDFVAKPGQITGLLGANGAGKTTVLRLLSTVLTPSAGSATVSGFDTRTQGIDVRRNIGFLSNSTALYGRLTGKEMLVYFGNLFGLSGSHLEDRIESVSKTLRLHDFRDQLCDKMSTGQKQRISIARAIVHDPPVLFFDEPTAGLDVVTSQTIMEFIEDVRSHGRTVILSTHIMSEVERLCDDVTIIHAGSVRANGTVESIKAQAGENSLEKSFLTLVGFYEQEAAS